MCFYCLEYSLSEGFHQRSITRSLVTISKVVFLDSVYILLSYFGCYLLIVAICILSVEALLSLIRDERDFGMTINSHGMFCMTYMATNRFFQSSKGTEFFLRISEDHVETKVFDVVFLTISEAMDAAMWFINDGRSVEIFEKNTGRVVQHSVGRSLEPGPLDINSAA